MWAETEESTPLAVVSHAWAIGQFGSADAAIGKTIEAVGQLLEIVGVTSAGFTYPASTDIWAPSSLIPINPNRGGHNYFVVGRLKPGVTVEEARTEMRAIAARLEREHPENRFKSIAITPMLDKLTSRAQTTLWLLFGTVDRRPAHRLRQRRPPAVGARGCARAGDGRPVGDRRRSRSPDAAGPDGERRARIRRLPVWGCCSDGSRSGSSSRLRPPMSRDSMKYTSTDVSCSSRWP